MYLQESSWLPLLLPGWWFGSFFIFPYIGNSNPNWLIFFRGVETTNQITIYITITAPMSVTLTRLLHCYHHCSDFYCHHEYHHYHHGCFRTVVDVVYRDLSGAIIHTCMYILFTIDFVCIYMYIYIWCTHTTIYMMHTYVNESSALRSQEKLCNFEKAIPPCHILSGCGLRTALGTCRDSTWRIVPGFFF